MNKPNYSIENFGLTASGQTVQAINLSCGAMSCRILSFGATLQALTVPDRNGNPLDIVLGYDSVEEYQKHDAYLGAVVGRYANRIAKGRFTLNGKEYVLAQNNGDNHLHGGLLGFSHKVWDVEDVGDCFVRLHLSSPDGDEGYPGNMDVWVTYTLSENSLSIRYEASSDADTLCNLTNHSYFNLCGHDSGKDILDHKLQLFTKEFTPVKANGMVDGTVKNVEPAMDFSTMKTIGQDINSGCEQIEITKGYDHNYVLPVFRKALVLAAAVEEDTTGRFMQVYTNSPGILFYSGNYLEDNKTPGKAGKCYPYRSGFCLETGFYPNALKYPNYPQPVLRKGDVFDYTTIFRFGVK